MIQILLYAFLIWLALLGTLWGTGEVLSRINLAMLRRARPDKGIVIVPRVRRLNRLYSAIIVLAIVYFYVSMPVLAILTFALGIGIIYAAVSFSISLGSLLPLLGTIFGVIFAGYTIFVVFETLLSRPQEGRPGLPLPRNQSPNLWKLTQAVATHLETNPIVAIDLTPRAEIGIVERGNLIQKMLGKGRRCLVLGLGAFNGLDPKHLEVILAHEYGHLVQRDTRLGYWVFVVLEAVEHMRRSLRMNNEDRWYNPAWLFAEGFRLIFTRMTLGARRLREVLADHYAIQIYGIEAFQDGLLAIARQNIVFDLQLKTEFETALAKPRAVRNVYTLPPPDPEKLKESLDQEWQLSTDFQDTHPALRERVSKGITEEKLDIAVTESLWPLLTDPDFWQTTMTAIVQRWAQERRRWEGFDEYWQERFGEKKWKQVKKQWGM